MGVSCAEDHVHSCHRCGYEFVKKCDTCTDKQCATCNDMIIITPKKSEPMSFWYLCNRCYEEEGGVWWVGKVPRYKVEK